MMGLPDDQPCRMSRAKTSLQPLGSQREGYTVAAKRSKLMFPIYPSLPSRQASKVAAIVLRPFYRSYRQLAYKTGTRERVEGVLCLNAMLAPKVGRGTQSAEAGRWTLPMNTPNLKG
jgi:hypothetical protein